MRLPFERFSTRIVTAALGAAALAAVGVGAMTMRAGASHAVAEDPVIRPARVMAVEYRDMTRSLVLAGTVVPRIESTLGFRVAGKIVRRAVDVGAVVKPGQVIAELDPADYRLAVDNARAALLSAESDSARAKADYERYLALRGTAAFMSQTLDTRHAAASTAQARVEQAKSQLATAENNLGYTELRADAEGVVTAVQAEVGQVMAQGQGVVRVARTDELEILVGVPEQRLTVVRQANKATFELWSDSGHRYAARLRELSPSADPMTRTYPARFSVTERPPFIGLGMTATLSFERPDAQHLAEVPLSAIFQQGTQPAVWVVDRATGVIALRPVTVARWNDDTAVISSGVKDGEMIATAGVHKLEPGQKVRPLLQQQASR
jgi:multidrug efflux system membrane fusion protein